MASKYLQKFPVPKGFPEILHDFAREILRDQPRDILDYGCEYFKALEEVPRIVITCIGPRLRLPGQRPELASSTQEEAYRATSQVEREQG